MIAWAQAAAAAAEIAAGDHSSWWLGEDGRLLCTNQTVHDLPPLRGIAAGGADACGLDAHGRIRCFGQLPDPPRGRFQSVSVGDGAVCALDRRGRARCWGALPDGPDVAFEAIEVGGQSACGLDAEGQASCWGAPVAVPPGPLRQLSIHGASSCGITRAGAIACAGMIHGEPATDTGWVDVDLGLGGPCAVSQTGALTCWGLHTWDGMADATHGVTAVEVGDDHVVIVQDGEMRCGSPTNWWHQCGQVRQRPELPEDLRLAETAEQFWAAVERAIVEPWPFGGPLPTLTESEWFDQAVAVAAVAELLPGRPDIGAHADLVFRFYVAFGSVSEYSAEPVEPLFVRVGDSVVNAGWYAAASMATPELMQTIYDQEIYGAVEWYRAQIADGSLPTR